MPVPPVPPAPPAEPAAPDRSLWDADRLKNPHAEGDKARRVRDMFAAIAPSYDLNNRLFSLGIDQRWRRKAVRLSELKADDVVVDVACGTGDLTLCYANGLSRLRRAKDPHADQRATEGEDHPLPRPEWLTAGQVVGVDYTYPMLPIAVDKTRVGGFDRKRRGYWAESEARHTTFMFQKPVQYINGDALALPLPDACCDVVSIAFGIRNVADPAAAFAEFRRVLRPGGRLVVLEFSLPTNPLIRTGYNFYFNQVLTRAATLVSGDKTGAYHYLSASVNTFIGREQMADLIGRSGFERVEPHPLTFGVAVCYVGHVAAGA